MASAAPTAADAHLFNTLPLFARLSADTRQRLLGAGVVREYAAGATLFTAGSQPPGLFVVLAGRVRVVRAHAGRQQVVHGEGPGGTLAEVPFFEGGTLPATAVASEDTRCLLLDRDALQRIMAIDPDLAAIFLRRLSTRVRELVDRLDRLGGQPVLARLAGYLARVAPETAGEAFVLGMTQSDLAEELGTAREVIVRGLAHLRATGIIAAAGRGRLAVTDGARLRAVADSWGA